MSRTKIYKMMDNKAGILLIGSNAISIDSLLFNNGVGFSQSCYQKSNPSFNDIPMKETFIEEFDAAAWLNESNSFLQTNVNNVNSTSDYLNTEELENTYSLDDILEGNTALPSPASTSSGVSINADDTPIASPLSDSLDFELEKFLNDSGAMGDFNNGNNADDLLFESSSEGIICEDMELNMIQNDLSNDLSVNMPLITNTQEQGNAQPLSPDSGIASPQSAEEPNFDLSSDLLLNMLNQAVQQNSGLSSNTKNSESIANNTLNSILLDQLLTFNSEAEIKNENDQQHAESLVSSEEEYSNEVTFIGNKKRHQPYKRRPRTEEQKVRKKAQNRNAAVRYRNKKKEELQEMMEEEEKLAAKNKELSNKVNGLKKEVEYLKSLMLDVIKARLAKGQDKQQSIALEMLLQSTSSN